MRLQAHDFSGTVVQPGQSVPINRHFSLITTMVLFFLTIFKYIAHFFVEIYEKY